jgi:hypothetical protein
MGLLLSCALASALTVDGPTPSIAIPTVQLARMLARVANVPEPSGTFRPPRLAIYGHGHRAGGAHSGRPALPGVVAPASMWTLSSPYGACVTARAPSSHGAGDHRPWPGRSSDLHMIIGTCWVGRGRDRVSSLVVPPVLA